MFSPPIRDDLASRVMGFNLKFPPTKNRRLGDILLRDGGVYNKEEVFFFFRTKARPALAVVPGVMPSMITIPQMIPTCDSDACQRATKHIRLRNVPFSLCLFLANQWN